MLTLPALRLTAEGKGRIIEEGVSLDLSPNRNLSVGSTVPEPHPNGTVSLARENVEEGLSPTTNHVKPEDSKGLQEVAATTDGEGSLLPTNNPNFSTNSIPERTSPHISRTLSMPLASQLSQLQNPHRPGPLNPHHSAPQISSVRSSRVDEVSIELADSIQLVIQTMLQISPPQVLDPAKEQFSACALSVPTSSMSAMFTAMKNINYISANMSSFCDGPYLEEPSSSNASDTTHHNEFDVGELLQCLGDALSGAAAQAGVDLVIYHGDVGVKHVYVSGDESGISFALSHIVRQILNTTERGDSIELGLLVGPVPTFSNFPGLQTASDGEPAAPLVDQNGAIRVTIRISHRFALSESQIDLPLTSPNEFRPNPSLSTVLLRRILRQICGTLKSDLPPPESFSYGRTCEFDLVLYQVATPVTPLCARSQNQPIEPTLQQLSSFGESLKGKRVTLYASVKGSFAHHLTSYLTTWGMDVTHVSPGGEVDGSTDQSRGIVQNSTTVSIDPALSSTRTEHRSGFPELIFIDDDVDILKDRLHALRYGNPNPPNINPRKKPSLQANHRPRSSQQVTRALNSPRAPTAVVILHFTSLSNYKLVKDVVQSIMVLYAAMVIPLPEIMIIPKPAGPRRFLTALHTAITKPTLDPFFIPIATPPMSPGGVPMQTGLTPTTTSPISENASNQTSIPGSQGNTAAITQPQTPLGKTPVRPTGSRTNSERSIKSLEGPGGLPTSALPPSPLALPDNVEYFSANAQKLGNSPSSGVVIQSPDGQTAGIYFHPRGKNGSRNPSSNNIEKEKVQLGPTTPPRRPSTSRGVTSLNKEDTMSFSYLYGSPQKTIYTPTKSTPPSDVAVLDIHEPSPPGPQLIIPSPTKIITTPLDSHQLKPSAPSPSTARSPSRQDNRGIQASPAIGLGEGGGASPTKRSSSKKPSDADTKDAKDTAPPSKQKGKVLATGDANVVPPISVLIVDDNPINQTILSTFMRRKKIKYDLACNGQEAVQKWRSGGFHLILMDIQMPIMDGIQATKEIRRLEKYNSEAGFPPLSPSPEGQTPSEVSATSSSSASSSETKNPSSPYRSSVIIVALTASSLQSDRVAALAAGCNDFLTKPVSLLWLNNKIIEWGSIKALQMWADIRPEAVRSISSGQAQQAKSVAERLHVPLKGRATPIPSVRSPSTIDENAAALALASSAGPMPGLQPGSSSLNTMPSPVLHSFAALSLADSSPAHDSAEVQSPFVPSTSVDSDDRINAKTLQGDLPRRSYSRSRTQAGSNTTGLSSDLAPYSSVAESVKARENGSTTAANSPAP